MQVFSAEHEPVEDCMGDELLFSNDHTIEEELFRNETDSVKSSRFNTWKVIIADDEEEVHAMTKMVLKKFEFDGRSLELISTYSGQETIEMMKKHKDVAIILLDVVMEKDNSGLEVVRRIRDELKNPFVRIILRTGQPGQAPEEDVIRSYDINDYKSKTELTVQKLYTSLIASLRSFKDMKLIESNRIGLEHIIKSTRKLFEIQSITDFSNIALYQLELLMDVNPEQKPYNGSGLIALKEESGYTIIAANNAFEQHIGLDLTLCEAYDTIHRAMKRMEVGECLFDGNCLFVQYDALERYEVLLYIEGSRNFNEFDRYLLRTFSANISIGYDNIFLNNEIIDTQREVIITLGEIVETRSKETANHVRRVAEYSYIMAIAAGFDPEEAKILRLASPMHDIGKIGIPDHILNKPGRLTPEEFDVIKLHTQIGYDILKQSSREIMKTAATIALQHHEKWDGQGYPNGLRADAIHMFSRITSLVDVYDALGHKRVYKDAWGETEIHSYIENESGKAFDPLVVKLFFENVDKLREIKALYPDWLCYNETNTDEVIEWVNAEKPVDCQ